VVRKEGKPREGLTIVCTLKVIVVVYVNANVALGLRIEDGVLYIPQYGFIMSQASSRVLDVACSMSHGLRYYIL
jgi:hypothetical protein